MPHRKPEMPPHVREVDGDVFGPLGDYLLFVLRAPFRHKRTALAVVVCTALVGAAVGRMVPLTYEVRAVLLAQRDPMLAVLAAPGAAREWDSPTNAAREMLLRRDNLEFLLKETNFAARYLQSRAPAVRARDWVMEAVLRRSRTPAQLEDDLAYALERRLWVWTSEEGVVTIGFTWSDPELALDVVQAAVRRFLEARHTVEIGGLGRAIAILESHRARQQNEIGEAITNLQQKLRSIAGASARARPALRPAPARVDGELVRLQGELAARRRALADLEDSRQRRQAELQAQLAQQLTVYGPAHPAVTATRAAIAAAAIASPQVTDLQSAIASLTREVTARGGAAGEAQHSREEEALAAELIRSSEAQDPRLDYERRELETLLKRQSSLVDRIESARIELEAAAKDFEKRYPVISPPKLPRGPLKPLGTIFAVAGLVLGLAAACVVSAVLDVVGGRLVEPWQVSRALKLPIVIDIRR